MLPKHLNLQEIKDLSKISDTTSEYQKVYFNGTKKDIESAKKIIEIIYRICKEEAKKGKKEAVVMELEYNDYKSSFPYNVLTPEKLESKARIVYEWCLKSGLKPEIRHWHDGSGIEGGFDIIAKWE